MHWTLQAEQKAQLSIIITALPSDIRSQLFPYVFSLIHCNRESRRPVTSVDRLTKERRHTVAAKSN